MRDLKRILVGHDLAAGGDLALRSAAAVAHRCGATLRLVHVVEPLNPYQRISHPLTTPFTLEEIAQKTGERLQALAASPDLAGRAEYEVRSGKPFVDLIFPTYFDQPIRLCGGQNVAARRLGIAL